MIFKRKFIPKGSYCYKIIKITYREDGMPLLKTRTCDYYDYRGDGEAWCRLMNEDISLWDMCKMCGKREGIFAWQ